MKTIHIKSTTAYQMLKDLQASFGGTICSLDEEHVLNLNNATGTGTISGFTIKNNMSYIAFNMVFNEDITLINQIIKSSPIYFTYCSEGHLAHSFTPEGPVNSLAAFQTAILKSGESVPHTYHFKKDLPLKFSTVVVSTDLKSLQTNELNDRLNQIFYTNKKENFVYLGSYNLKIAEKIKQLEAISQEGVVRRLLIESTIQTILALEIQQHEDDLEQASNPLGTLTLNEMEMVKEVSLFIRNYPEKQYTLKYLSAKSCLSPCKLQEGFKLLYNRTVTDYIRNVRVEKAEELIKTTNLNISEIVYTVGLTSRSYFSKIFKEKYNCSPKQYQDKQNTLAATA